MTTRIPRQFTAQDHLDMAEHFKFNVSVDSDVVESRAMQRGKHVNIGEDESAGLDVGTQVLERLDPELQKVWAKLLGGTMLNSALYTLRELDNQPMSRHFKFVRMVDSGGTRLDDDTRRSETIDELGGLKLESDKLVETRKKGVPTERSLNRLGHRLGDASMLVGIFASDFDETESEFSVMSSVLQQNIAMQRAIQQLAERLEINPSLAQLRADNTPLGADIIHTNTYPLEIKRTFRDVLDDVSRPQGY